LVSCSNSNAIKPTKTFETAVDLLNDGKSAAEIYKLLHSVKRFKELLPKEAPKVEFQVPELPSSKQTTESIKKHIVEEEENHEKTLLGKRKESECGKTKLGTKDITSFFAPKRLVHTSSVSCASESYTLRDNFYDVAAFQ
jgi:hypothetical protein